MLILRTLSAFIFFCICHQHLFAQTYNHFAPLSTIAYPERISVLKSRKVPNLYKDKKEQKTYEEIIKDRNETIAADFVNDRIIHDTLLLNKCNSIVKKIQAANKSFSFDSIRVFINRSPVANASCYGEGTLFINLGLFFWLDNEDELALIIGHELSHQFLDHSETKIKNNISLLSSDEFKNEIKAIKKSTDGRYERYRNLIKDLVTRNGTHSRFKETEADSLALILIKNAGYNVQDAARVLLKLEHVDDLFTGSGMYSYREMMEKTGADPSLFQAPKKYNGLSKVNVTMNADNDLDSIKTHPDCIERYKQLIKHTTEIIPTTCCKTLTSNFALYKERALIEAVRYAFEAKRYTLCAHLCLFAVNNGYTNPYYAAFLSNSFSGIYWEEKLLNRFSVTDMQAKFGSTLKELQDIIFNASSANVATISSYFLSQLSEANTEDYHFSRMMYDIAMKPNDGEILKSKFIKSFPDSKYIYLIKPKTK